MATAVSDLHPANENGEELHEVSRGSSAGILVFTFGEIYHHTNKNSKTKI